MRKADGVSMNVDVKIGYLEVDIMEKIEPEDYDYDVLRMDHIQHRELMKLKMSDLILDYRVDRRGVQTVTVILTQFDMIDKIKIKGPDGSSVPMIADIYSCIVSNPEN